MDKIWALVPLKSLANAKQRLRTVLDADLCKQLVTAMIKDVLSAIDGVDEIDHILLVTTEAEAPALFQSDDIEIYSGGIGVGLNEDLEKAAAYAASKGAEKVLIVHGDLPLLTTESLCQFLQVDAAVDTRAANCKTGKGTNLLLTQLPLRFPLVFGKNSLMRFRHEVGLLSQIFESINHPALRVDIDDPCDLSELIESVVEGVSAGATTSAMLQQSANRIKQRMTQPDVIPTVVNL